MDMKKLPIEFAEFYQKKKSFFEKVLEEIKKELQLRISQLRYRKGVRARITDVRVKGPRKIWKNAQQKGLNNLEVFRKTEDLLGIRIVCNNLSDINSLIEMIQKDVSTLKVEHIKDLISFPSSSGYRAVHVRTVFQTENDVIPCEIQIRTLAQDIWARLSREDLYGKRVPPSIQKLAQALATQLSAIDEIAQLIRDELNKCPPIADQIQDSDAINPERLALLYKEQFKEDIWEWTLLDWMKNLEEAEIETIGEVRTLLNNKDLRKKLDDIAIKIRGFSLNNSEWAVYSALVTTQLSEVLGIKMVKKHIQDEWEEIIAFARNEILSELPETIDEFIEELESGYLPIEALEELGGVINCSRCGSSVIEPYDAANAVLEFYNITPDDSFFDEKLSELLYLLSNFPESEDSFYDGLCSWCAHQLAKLKEDD